MTSTMTNSESNPSKVQAGARGFSTPAVDIFESDAAFRIVAELPGVVAEDVSLSLEPESLTLSAPRRDQPLDYRRKFTLSVPVEAEKVEARLEDGVLELELPKAASAQPRAIPVRAG